jgi:hypothetical protein
MLPARVWRGSQRSKEAQMDEKSRISRRSLLKGAMLVATGGMAAGVIVVRVAHAQKMSKADAKYQDTPKDGQKCSDCVYFQPPKSCAVVEGDVSPNGWTILFNKKAK